MGSWKLWEPVGGHPRRVHLSTPRGWGGCVGRFGRRCLSQRPGRARSGSPRQANPICRPLARVEYVEIETLHWGRLVQHRAAAPVHRRPDRYKRTVADPVFGPGWCGDHAAPSAAVEGLRPSGRRRSYSLGAASMPQLSVGRRRRGCTRPRSTRRSPTELSGRLPGASVERLALHANDGWKVATCACWKDASHTCEASTSRLARRL